MIEIISDLRTLDEEGGDILADHGIVQELEAAMLDMAGKVVRIQITEYRPHQKYPYLNTGILKTRQ